MDNQPQEQKQALALSSVSDLLKRGWTIYKNKFRTIVGVMIFPLILSSLIQILNLEVSSHISVTIILWVVWTIIYFWLEASLIFAIKEREEGIRIVETLKKGWSIILSFIWVKFLTGLVIFVGLLLLFIPGIIFAVWFAFSGYILIFENLKGFEALSRSRQLTRGYWWGVFWRFFSNWFYFVVGRCYIFGNLYWNCLSSIFSKYKISVFLLRFLNNFINQWFIYLSF